MLLDRETIDSTPLAGKRERESPAHFPFGSPASSRVDVVACWSARVSGFFKDVPFDLENPVLPDSFVCDDRYLDRREGWK